MLIQRIGKDLVRIPVSVHAEPVATRHGTSADGMDDWRFLPPEQVVSVEKEHEYFFRSIGGPIKTFRVTIVKPIPVERLHHIVPGLSCVGLGGGRGYGYIHETKTLGEGT